MNTNASVKSRNESKFRSCLLFVLLIFRFLFLSFVHRAEKQIRRREEEEAKRKGRTPVALQEISDDEEVSRL